MDVWVRFCDGPLRTHNFSFIWIFRLQERENHTLKAERKHQIQILSLVISRPIFVIITNRAIHSYLTKKYHLSRFHGTKHEQKYRIISLQYPNSICLFFLGNETILSDTDIYDRETIFLFLSCLSVCRVLYSLTLTHIMYTSFTVAL